MKAITVRLMERKHDEAIDRLIQSHKENVKEITAYYTAKIADLESTAQPVSEPYKLSDGRKLVPFDPAKEMFCFVRDWSIKGVGNDQATGCNQAMLAAPAQDDKSASTELPNHSNLSTNSPVIPDGWKLVPIEPTENMIIDGFESEPDKTFSKPEVWEEYAAMSGCKQAAHRAKLCWAAMLAAAPTPQKGE